jgi:vacuolar-type H+-ATPase subunit I/STV1
MGRIMRIFVVGATGDKQTLAFDMSKFVAYNVDTRQLLLDDTVEVVHRDSEERLIRAYQLMDEADSFDFDELRNDLESAEKAIDELLAKIGQLEDENASLRAKCDAYVKERHHKKSAWEYIMGKR